MSREANRMNLQPGPELDKRICEAFGWPNYIWEEAGERFVITRGIRFEPSTTWNGMQLVVEEMQRRGFEFRFGSYETVSFTWKHWAKFNDEIKEYETITSDALPFSVCVAALSALGALEGQEDE